MTKQAVTLQGLAVSLHDLADGQRELADGLRRLTVTVAGIAKQVTLLTEKVTKLEIGQAGLSTELRELRQYTESGFDTMNNRFGQLEGRVDYLEEEGFERLEGKVDRIQAYLKRPAYHPV